MAAGRVDGRVSGLHRGSNLTVNTGGRSSPGGASAKPTTFDELNRILSSRGSSLSTRINSVLQVLDDNRDNLRGFFSNCYQTLLWQIFNFDDGASGWLQSVSSGSEREASILLDFLSPKGALIKAVFAADADGLMQFAFPIERLPERTQRLLRTNPAGLNAKPPYRGCVQRDAQGRFAVHLGLYHYFLFWSAYYACSEARGTGRRYSRSPARNQWRVADAAAMLGGLYHGGDSRRVHPYRELLLSHLRCFLPRGGAGAGNGSWGNGNVGAWTRASEANYRGSGSVSQGEMLVSIFIEFWLPDGDVANDSASVGGVGARSPFTPGGLQRGGGSAGSMNAGFYGVVASSMQRQYTYNPPNEDLINAVVLLATYLFADASPTAGGGRGTPSAATPPRDALEGMSPRSPRSISKQQLTPGSASMRTPPLSSPAGVGATQDAREEVERAKEMLLKPLYTFLRDAFTHWPAESTARLGPLLNLWVTYLTPWTLSFPVPSRSRSGGGGSPLSRGIEAVAAATSAEKKYSSPSFLGDTSPLNVSTSSGGGRRGQPTKRAIDVDHVLHNIPFYNELMKHFLELCCKRVPVDAEGTATALLSVLQAFASCPEVLQLIDDFEEAYNAFVVRDPFSPAATNAEPPPPTPYDAFYPYVKSQLLEMDPPEQTPDAVGAMSPSPIATRAGMRSPMYGAAANANPAVVPKLSMFALDQEGLPQVALALLHRLDRDVAALGPNHPLRSRLPRLRKAAFKVFRLERLGESATMSPSPGAHADGSAKASDGAGGVRSRRGGIGFQRASFDKGARALYTGDWNTRPITNLEFPPLARLLIAISENLNDALALTGDQRIQLRILSEYGTLLAISIIVAFFWILFF